ncbi:MAG: GC-type dockerin domain-anchored protein [bacterium]
MSITRSRLSPRRALTTAAWALACACGTTAMAEPKLVVTSLSEGISADGTKAVGYLFDYSIPGYTPFVWQRGVGYSSLPGTGFGNDPIHASADITTFATGLPNTANWGNLNCFTGYNPTTGAPEPQITPCLIPNIAHRYTAATGWVNTGSLPRFQDPDTGRFFGGTRCDFTINSANDLSGDGNTIVGGAYTSPLTSSFGGPSSGVCTDFYAFKYVASTATLTQLPIQPDSTGSRADSVSNDGSVIVGHDVGDIPSENGPYQGRRACVWTNNVQTLIDPLSGSSSSSIVNGAGNAISGVVTPAFAQPTFGIEDVQLVKWTRQPNNSWTPAALGKLIDLDTGTEIKPFVGWFVTAVSDDGNTIVGNAQYGISFWDRVSRPFIWSPTINAGVPLDFATYLAQTAPTSPIVQGDISIIRIDGMSADGNAIAVTFSNTLNTCTPPEASLNTGDRGIIYLNGASVPGEAPTIALPPRDYTSTQYTPLGVALNVAASGTFPMTYTWQREDPANPGQWLGLTEACAGFIYGGEWDYEGVTKNQLRIGQALCGNNRDGNYRVIVSNAFGSATSTPAAVSFAQGTLITQQPQNATVCNGSQGSTVAIAVTNSPDLAQQWEIASSATPTDFLPLFDGDNILSGGQTVQVSGATGQFISLTPSLESGAGTYLLRCHFISPCGDATSDTVTLTINFCRCTASDVAGPGQSVGPDAELTADDIIVFLNWFFAGDFRADVSGPGQSTQPDYDFTADDIIVFLNRFFAGC